MRVAKRMDIIVANRETVERSLVVRGSYAMISITDPDMRKAQIPRAPGRRAVLRVQCDDVEPVPDGPMAPELAPMSEEDAERIATFVHEQAGSVDAFVIHCEQGMSRSPAVAAAIADYLGEEPLVYFQHYSPNAHVFKLAREWLLSF